MKKSFSSLYSLVVLIILSPLSLPLSFAQTPPQNGTLTVTGHIGQTPVVQINGRSYVDIEALARLTQGSLTFKGNQIVLTLPAAAADATAAAQPKPGFSKDFLEAGIEELSVIREWRIAIVDAIRNNYPITEDWVSTHRRKADKSLALAGAAISTDDDRSGYPLLQAEFRNMRAYSDRFLSLRQQATYIDPNSVDNDPLDQQILTCSRALAAMAASNKFQDELSCH